MSEEPPMNVGTLGRENLRQVSDLHRRSMRGWPTGETVWLWLPTVAVSVVIGVVTLVLRLAYGASRPTDPLGAALVAGSKHFDVRRDMPPAPGSWLYVAAGHTVEVVAHMGAVHSLVLLSALLSAAAAAVACLAGTLLGGRWVGMAAAAVIASAPVAWFAGSTVSPYGIDALLGALLLVLARRARAGGAHGVLAVLALGLGAGIRLSVVPEFALLAAVAVVASVRTVGHLLAVIGAGLGSVAVWFVPMILLQPGGLHAWLHAVHVQFSHAADTSSVFAAPGSGAITTIGRFGGWSLVSLGPVLVLAVLAVVVMVGARLATGQPGGNASLRIWSTATEPRQPIERPWYQTTGAILTAALIPPLGLATLFQFPAGGAVLSYLVPATILGALPLGRLLHHRVRGLRRTAAVLATVLVAGAVVVNVQRFVTGPGILPAQVARDHPGLWLSKARYQSPYPDTAATIRAADASRR
jgi:hypothetical protein